MNNEPLTGDDNENDGDDEVVCFPRDGVVGKVFDKGN